MQRYAKILGHPELLTGVDTSKTHLVLLGEDYNDVLAHEFRDEVVMIVDGVEAIVVFYALTSAHGCSSMAS